MSVSISILILAWLNCMYCPWEFLHRHKADWHLLQNPLEGLQDWSSSTSHGPLSKDEGKRIWIHKCGHMSLPKTIFLLSESLHLHSILPFVSSSPASLIHLLRGARLHDDTLRCSLQRRADVILLIYLSPAHFLSLVDHVMHRDSIDRGSVFIGSVISTPYSHAPLRGWKIEDWGNPG